jgi:hypothetical protein
VAAGGAALKLSKLYIEAAGINKRCALSLSLKFIYYIPEAK